MVALDGLRRTSEIPKRALDWLWYQRLPRGMFTEICGDPGSNKSYLTLAIAAAVSRGRKLPGDRSVTPVPPAQSIFICTEDSDEVTVVPRLEALDADTSRIFVLEDGSTKIGGKTEFFQLSNPRHRDWLESMIRDLGVTFVNLDPITAHLGAVDEWKDSDVRSVLSPVAGIARRTGATINVVRHLNKNEGAKAIYRAGGSIAFTGTVRSSLIVGRVSPNHGETGRVVARLKGNLCQEPPSIRFDLLPDDEVGIFKWGGSGAVTASELIDSESHTTPELDKAIQFLEKALGGGEAWVADIEIMAQGEDISRRTLTRAKDRLGVIWRRVGSTPGSPTMWKLPEISSEHEL